MRSTDDRRGESVVQSSVPRPSRSARPPLDPADRPKACYAKALDALARSSRSKADLARWLKDREFTPEEIEPVLSKLEALGLLDDRAFARGFARTRLSGRGFGPRRVAAELARRGVSRPIVDAVLDEFAEEAGSEAARAVVTAASRRAKSLRGLDDAVAERRLIGYLVRRGYGPGESRKAAREALASRPDR